MEPKDKLKKMFSDNYDKYYKVKLFSELGFMRKKCKCGTYFWTLDRSRVTCPNPPCQTYQFIGNPIKKKMDYLECWNEINKFFVKNGHESIPSYPIVCRWFPGLYFTIASIIAFQRSIAGKTVFEMPDKPVIIPQVCARFNDIPNVGVTGRHFTNFTMVGQACIYTKEREKFGNYWKDKCVDLDFHVLTDVFRIDPEEVVFVEDVWMGPAAFGYSLEYYVRGLELGNAVFTEFLGNADNYKQMDYKVIDMGAGLERFAWISQGTNTAYDAVFGPVVDKMKKKISFDKKLFTNYSSLAGNLNLDEVANIKEAKLKVAKDLGVSLDELVSNTSKLEALYAIADHTKTLLYSITDGALPSNVGGGYNLRVILRRALGFIDKFNFDFSLEDIAKDHAKYLKDFSPRLIDNVNEFEEIINVEKKRFENNRKRSVSIIEKLPNDLKEDKLSELYESHGITPEMIMEINDKAVIPPSFYVHLSKKHMDEKEQKDSRDFEKIQETKILYYDNVFDFMGKVIKIEDDWVFLDKTGFYPEGGGQANDEGLMNKCKVFDVQKFGHVVGHRVENINFSVGDDVLCKIDKIRRDQLMKHHTAIHVINGAARKVLGNHIWQAGAKKTVEKAHLDITHYEALTEEQTDKIESVANEIIKKGLKTKKHVLPRIEAEKKFGMRIYQGGIVPENMLRILEIGDFDVEACGGTHCDDIAIIDNVCITSTERIQDGVVRITIVAGRAAEKYMEDKKELIRRIEDMVGKGDIIKKVQELHDKWKQSIKKKEHNIDDKAASIAKKINKKSNVIVDVVEGDQSLLQSISKHLYNDDVIVLLIGKTDKLYIFGSKGKNVKIHIGNIVKRICEDLGGKGGGSAEIGQGVGFNFDNLESAMNKIRSELHG